MTFEQLIALLTGLAGVGWIGKFLLERGNQKITQQQNAYTAMCEIAENYKSDYTVLKKELEQLRQDMDRRDYDFKLERKEWQKEREQMQAENKELNERVTLLEEALIDRGVDVNEL